MSSIPLVDLKAQHAELAEEIRAGWERVLDKTAFILGDDVASFEEELAAFIGVKHVVGVANGTDALELGLRAVGVGAGDEVILPANTFIATAIAVARAGAQVVLADCDDDGLLDPDSAAARITPRTRAILPVHLYGQCADMARLGALAQKHGLLLVEDAAQAQGARQGGRSAGTFGMVAGTSFYPGKNLGGYGDGGAVMTNDPKVAGTLKALRNYGSEVKYKHPVFGVNSRLDTLQAVVLRAKLKRLGEYNARRRAAAERYHALLGGVKGVTLPSTASGNEHIWHIYAVRVPERDRVLKALQQAGIGAAVHYPVPIHLQGAFAGLGHKAGDFPKAEQQAASMVSLPIYPELREDQQARVSEALRAALG